MKKNSYKINKWLNILFLSLKRALLVYVVQKSFKETKLLRSLLQIKIFKQKVNNQDPKVTQDKHTQTAWKWINKNSTLLILLK